MKTLLALGVALIATPLAASPTFKSLPGVADEETEITHGRIMQFERGHGDVIFVRDQADRWYRLQLNDGCLRRPLQLDQMIFDSGNSSRIDKFTRITIPKDLRTCSIDSIRRSEPPPQVNSKSHVTLD